jgi:hypothetical protein
VERGGDAHRSGECGLEREAMARWTRRERMLATRHDFWLRCGSSVGRPLS